MFVTALIAAGGRGQRLGQDRPKQLIAVGGRSILERSVGAFLSHPEVDELVVALPQDVAADPPACLRSARKPVRLVVGGARRQDSVANAFRAASPESGLMLIHDAARPFVSAALISRMIAATRESGAAIAAVQARDTVKRGDGAGAAAKVVETLPRESIYLAQTPQGFLRGVLADALALSERGVEATDEAGLAERAGHQVRLVEGEASNIKITTRDDLAVAEAILGAGAALSIPRIGIGYDLHRLVEGRPLILGGVHIPFDRGLLGHSDADAVCHAVTDAVLGGVGQGDIGGHFPDTDPQWRGASSTDLLRQAVALVHRAGWAVINVDVVVIAEKPKLGPYLGAMRTTLAAILGVEPGCVGIKGKTSEGLGEIGRGEAMAVHATALLQSSR